MRKKSISIILALLLLLSSCSSTIPTSLVREPASVKSCRELMQSFIDISNVSHEKLIKKIKLDLSSVDLNSFLNLFPGMNVNKLDSSELDTLRAMYLFSSTSADPKMKERLALTFVGLKNGEAVDPNNKDWSRFMAHKNKVDKHREKLLTKNPTREGRLHAENESLLYEKLYYSCRAQTQKLPSAAELKQAKYLTYALTAGAAASTSSTYAVVNWEEEKDAKWMKGLYFEVALSAIFTYVGGKFVTTNPKLNPWKHRAPLTYLNAAGADAGTSAVYAYFFNASSAELEAKLEAIKKDPKAQEELSELLYYAQENKLFEKHAKAIESLFKNKKGYNNDQKLTEEEIRQAIDTDKIDLEETRELLMEAIAEKQYNEEQAGPLSVGSPATDRYAFHRLWGLASVPANISLALIMQKQMCMSTNPKLGFAKAVSLYFAGSILLDAIYYKSRREVIHQ